MTDDERKKLLYRVAQLHFNERRTNTQIANSIQVSSTHVVRLLWEAIDEKIVRIDIIPPTLLELSNQLRLRFRSLKEILVIPSVGDFEKNQEILGTAAAEYFDRSVEEGTKVGFSGGNTIDLMIKAVPERERNLDIYPTQLIGQGPHIPQHKDVFVALSELWDKCKRHGTASYTSVPPPEPTELGKRKATAEDIGRKLRMQQDRLKRSPVIKTVWEGMHQATTVFASVGLLDPNPNRPLMSRTLLALLGELGIGKSWLEREGVVGDLGFSLFDANGNTRSPRWDFFLTLGVDHFKTMAADHPQRRVVLVVGEGKTKALAAALRGKLANVLITLDTVAEELLKL